LFSTMSADPTKKPPCGGFCRYRLLACHGIVTDCLPITVPLMIPLPTIVPFTLPVNVCPFRYSAQPGGMVSVEPAGMVRSAFSVMVPAGKVPGVTVMSLLKRAGASVFPTVLRDGARTMALPLMSVGMAFVFLPPPMMMASTMTVPPDMVMVPAPLHSAPPMAAGSSYAACSSCRRSP